MDDARPEQRPARPAVGPARPPRPPSSHAAIGLLLIAVLVVTAYARALLMPVVLAVLLMLVFTPLRRALDRRGVPSGVTAGLVVAGLMAAGVVGITVLAAPASELVAAAPDLLATLEREADRLVRAMGGLVGAGGGGLDAIDPGDAREAVVTQGGGAALGLAGLAPAVLAQMAFVLLLLFFLLASGDMIYEKIVHVSPTFGDKRRAMAIARDIETRLARYLSAITLINAGLGVAVALAFWAIGMPNPMLFGALAFALNFVPYLGAALGVAIGFVVGLVSFEEPALAFVAAGLYLAITSIEGNVVTPYFVGRALRLNTVVVFLSVALWAYMWSTVGMLVATPLLVVVRTVCEHVPALRPVSAFLSGRGVELEEAER